jgi:cytochrome oxidase Cu insertion factor (SCO1/SenC/PrrC family)
MTKKIWVGLLCIVFALMLFDNLIAQDRSQRARRRMPRWKGPDIGTVVEDFSLKTVDGKTFSLSDVKGKIFVMELGACT